MKKTTFILGAGASVDFKFPSGKDLKQLIINKLRMHDGVNKFSVMATSIEECAVNSIDAYLDIPIHKNNAEYIKPLIGEIIMESEQTDIKDKFNQPRENVYGWLFNLLEKENGWGNTNFVSFNYDRLLEHFFFKALKARRGVQDQEIFKIIYQSKIIHVFGRMPLLVGEENFVKDLGQHKWGYGQEIRPQYGEAQEESKEIKELISSSELVVSLGCAYHEPNIKLLGYDFVNNPQNIELWGTSYKMDVDEMRRMTRLLPKIKSQNVQCQELLKHIEF